MADLECAQMRGLLLGGGEVATTEARRHLEECPGCAALARNGGELARRLGAAAPSDAAASVPTFDALEDRLAREGSFVARLASLPSGTRWLLTCAALAVPVTVGLVELRPDMAVHPAARLALELLVLAGLAVASCSLWLRPLYRPAPRRWMFAALLGLGLLVTWLLAAFPDPPRRAVAGAHAASCFIFGSALALPVVLVVAGLGRRGRTVATFALLPVLAGALMGLVGLELHCPDTSRAHLLAGHAPILASWLLLAGIVLWLARPRQRRVSRQ